MEERRGERKREKRRDSLLSRGNYTLTFTLNVYMLTLAIDG